ncbi:MAG: EF-hand domain-containing protein [Planctomycetes bacterium]|nr:EF-hand domain-containing protein [Planctomycetota bacterium]
MSLPRRRAIILRCMVVAAALLCTLLAAGCVTDSPRTRAYAWPFYRADVNPETGDRTSGTLGPIADKTRRTDGFVQTNVRPFYSYTRDPQQFQQEQTFFYPLGMYRERERPGPEWWGDANNDGKVTLEEFKINAVEGAKDAEVEAAFRKIDTSGDGFIDLEEYKAVADWERSPRLERRAQFPPIFWWNDVSYAPGHRELDYFFFPLVFGGNSTIEGSHFAVVPFGGNIKGVLANIFGGDELRFVMFPLYAEVRNNAKKRVTYYLPFPLVRWGYGPGYKTYGALPFFMRTEQWRDEKDAAGKATRIPVADRWTIMWPLFRYDRDRMDKKYPRESLMVYPFFGMTKTAVTFNLSFAFILNYPMFSYTRADLTDTTIIDAFWPIFRIGRGRNFEQFRIWPLYDYSKVNGNTAINVMWPLFWYFDDITPWYREERYQIFPIFFANFRRYLPEPDGTVRTRDLVRVWPFAKYRKDPDNTVNFEMLSLFPFNDEKFDRTYGPLFKFLTVRAGPKEAAVQALFRIFNYEEDPTHLEVSLAPLFRWEVSKEAKDRLPPVGQPHPGDVENFDLLYGLLGYHHGPKERYIKLFWGIKIPTGEPAPEKNKSATNEHK